MYFAKYGLGAFILVTSLSLHATSSEINTTLFSNYVLSGVDAILKEISVHPVSHKTPTQLYDLGVEYYHGKNWNKAITVFHELLETQPDNQDARFFLAYALLFRYESQTLLNKSEQLFKRVLILEPHYLDAEIGLRKIEELRHPVIPNKAEDEKSVDLLLKKIHKQPKEAENFYELGKAYYRLQMFDESIEAYQRVLKLKPDHIDALLGLAYALLGQYGTHQDLLNSLHAFQTVLKEYPDYPEGEKGLQKVLSLLYPKEETKNKVQDEKAKEEKSLARLNFLHLLDDEKTEKNFEELSSIIHYETLTISDPSNPIYFYELGKAYAAIEEYNRAIIALRHALKLQPENTDIEVALAYAHLHRYATKKSLDDSELLFRNVLLEYPQYTDAEEGIVKINKIRHPGKIVKNPSGAIAELKKKAETPPELPENYYKLARAYFLSLQWDDAIEAYLRALELDPYSADAAVGLGYALLSSYISDKDLNSSRELFQRVLKQTPNYKDAQEGLKTVDSLLPKMEEAKKEEKKNTAKTSKPEEKPPTPAPPPEKSDYEKTLASTAELLSKQQNHWGAIEIYELLAVNFPENTDYLFNLGREFVKIEYHNTAVDIFERALSLKPDNTDVLTALGNQYLYFNELCISLDLFLRALWINPCNSDALYGIARITALLERPDIASEYYATAVEISPHDTDIWNGYANLLLTQRRFSESEYAFRYLEFLKNNFSTYRTTLLDISSYTTPSFFAKTGFAEEREKDLFSHKWVASLSTLFAEAGISYPIDDQFRIGARVRDGYVQQRLLVSDRTQFNAKLTGGAIRSEWFYDPFWTISLDIGFDWASNNEERVLLPTQEAFKFEPSLLFRYATEYDKIVFGEVTDTWIFRDFEKMKLNVITREAALLSYQHNFDDYRMIGASAAWLWYGGPIKNQEQDADVWALAGIPCFEDWLKAGYHCQYRQFHKELTAYYSFQYQLTHWLKIYCSKRWAAGPHCEWEYWHGWRTTRGRSPQQQIIVTPIFLTPVVTVENQIDQIFLTLGYTPTDYCDVSLVGTYYHDSFDYTASGIKLLLDWRF